MKPENYHYYLLHICTSVNVASSELIGFLVLFLKACCRFSALIKCLLYSQEAAWTVTDESIQIMGGMGFMKVSDDFTSKTTIKL